MVMKICLVSSCLSHIIEATKHTEDIVRLDAFRNYFRKRHRKEQEGIVKIVEDYHKKAKIDFSGREQLKKFGFVKFPLEDVSIN